MSFKIIIWRRACQDRVSQRNTRPARPRPRPIFWSQAGLVLRSTVSDHITPGTIMLGRGGGWLDVLFVGDMRSLGSSSFWSNAQRAIYSEKKKESIRSEIQITDTVFVNRRTHHSMGSARVLLFSSGSRGGRTRRAPPLFSEEKRIFKNIYYLLNKILIYCVFNQLLTKFQ